MLRKKMLILLVAIVILAVPVFLFLMRPDFGRLPVGSSLDKIQNSPNYSNGSFQNLSPTPQITEGISSLTLTKEYLFKENKRTAPTDSIPSIKTNLLTLNRDKDVLVWFGHSSYFIQIDQKRVLVDPIFSNAASPIPFTVKPFKGTNVYKAEDIPDIDYLLLTHDHWDHLDYDTLLKLKPCIDKVICGLGVGEHLKRWGFDPNRIIEMDWNEELVPNPDFAIYCFTARHFSGRGLKRNQSLWASFLLQTPSMKIYIGGDSGYDTFFGDIGQRFGKIDLVILENGQYDKGWRYIHMMPDEVLKAADDLHAAKLLPVHNSKFTISNHAWDEPLIKITELNGGSDLKLLTPMIGETVYLKNDNQTFARWWEGIN